MPSNDKAVWLLRFARRLHEIQPAVSGVAAAEIAVATYPDAQDLAPEEAADIYALEEPPSEVGAPGD